MARHQNVVDICRRFSTYHHIPIVTHSKGLFKALKRKKALLSPLTTISPPQRCKSIDPQNYIQQSRIDEWTQKRPKLISAQQ